ncbi:MAG: GNAT family N-acetyltransferase [Candidatus Dormibacteraeota bacterium]|nr:GNAT family N-acetyltransferase [Candidatus Dormibacteraeota bacterium]MBV8445974.1 GNAT family N-acetyltransferase [Candidatus Dormibacteraeota bacterium]
MSRQPLRRGSVTAPPAMLEFEGFSLQPLSAKNAGAIIELHRRPWNAASVDVPATPEQIVQLLGILDTRPLALPMMVVKDNRIVAVASPTMGNVRNLTAYFFAVFDDGEHVHRGLAAFVRHVFWSLPLHRLYLQVPVVEASDRYREMMAAVGFRDEGTMAGHVLVAGEPRDVAVLGMLRSDFDAWSAEFAPDLSLVPHGST